MIVSFKIRAVLCALGTALVIIAVPGRAIAQTDEPGLFRQEPCNLPDMTPSLRPRLRCGTVTVPRDPGAADMGTFRLAVVIIKAEAGSHESDPVVYIAGGPGSPLTSQAALIAGHEAAVIAPGRDLILVDQRAAGRSDPALCPGLARQQLAIFAAGLDLPALVQARRESFAACRQEMAAHGLQPEWFGTQITAADFEIARRSLGIDRWNVYARSYGTAVAMTMMALDPRSLRAVVLDSVYPPDPLPMTRSQSFGRALELLFAACRAASACATVHPDLEAAFGEALRGLDAEPLPVPMLPGLGIETVRLRAAVFRLIVNRALYSRSAIAALPTFIEAARDRKPMELQSMIDRVARSFLAMSVGDVAAVECRDRASWQAADPITSASDLIVSAFDHGLCAHWSAPGLPVLIARNTEVPTLLLAGTIDPITPPAFAQIAATAMGPKATVIEFANVGHGAEQSSACGEALVAAFMRSPSSVINAGCAAQIPPIGFR